MLFSAALSTKRCLNYVTYAQNLCLAPATRAKQHASRYQRHSESKLLIYIAFLKCFFYGQSSQSLDFKGLQPNGAKLSTKLSTEKVSFRKALANQALSASFACFYEEVSTISHTLTPSTVCRP
jgi:hypothetical protein